jgi:hypothetical protein
MQPEKTKANENRKKNLELCLKFARAARTRKFGGRCALARLLRVAFGALQRCCERLAPLRGGLVARTRGLGVLCEFAPKLDEALLARGERIAETLYRLRFAR